MASEQMVYINPNTGKYSTLSQTMRATLLESYNGKRGYPDLDETFIRMNASNTDTGTTVTSKSSALVPHYNVINGGEYVPNASLEGNETYLSADILAAGVSMVVESSTTDWTGIATNIFVADRPYLLMNRKPLPGESVFDTGVDADGLLKPAAEVIFVGAAYTSGTTVVIVRSDPNAADRKRFAVIQAIPGAFPSYGETDDKGILVEFERPLAVSMTDAAGDPVSDDGGSQTIDVRFVASTQQANTKRTSGTYSGEYGVVTHYGAWVLPESGPFTYAVRGLPEQCPPSQYDDTGQVDAVLAIDDAALTDEVIATVSYKKMTGINRYWDPADNELKAITAGNYWVGVRAMNQGTFDSNLRASKAEFTLVTIA
jgi:hypothetical protein